MPFISRPEGPLYYEVHGKDGPTVVMLRGLGRSLRHWLGFEKEVATFCRVVTVELRGIGRSKAALSLRHSMFDLADDVAAVLDHLHCDQAHLLGVSLGGMVSLAFGLAHPKRCQSLMTINTSIAGQFLPRITPRALGTIAQALAPAKSQRQLWHLRLVDVLTSPAFSPEERLRVARRYEEIADEDGLYVATVLKQLVVASRFHVKKRLAQLSVPTLLIYGTDDQFVPTRNTIKLADVIPTARLVAIPAGGHELSVDQPQALLAAMRAWLAEQQESTRPSGHLANSAEPAATRATSAR